MATTTIKSGAISSSPITEASLARQSQRIWLRLLLFLAPIVVVTALPVYLLDPYKILWSKPGIVPEELKQRYGPAINDVLWKLPQYEQHPQANILLGDSQT